MNNERLLWIDFLKFLAVFGVIGIHVSSAALNINPLFSFNWYQGIFFESIFRFAIILFIMASGYLLLRKQQPIEVIPKRIKRILLPFIFWLIVYAIIKIIFRQGLGPNWQILDIFTFIIKGFLDPTLISVQFWYVYMILGLYILSPVLSRWIQNAPIREIEYLLIVWVIVSIFQFFNIDSILLDYLRYFTGAIGYFILGYYLAIKNNHALKNKQFGLMLFIIGTLITFVGTILLSVITNQQSLFFIRLGDITPGACLQAIGIYIIVFNTDFDRIDNRFKEYIINISKTSYGIYLVNVLVLNLFEKIHIINLTGFAFFDIIIGIILVTVVSYIIIIIMDKIKILRSFSGLS